MQMSSLPAPDHPHIISSTIETKHFYRDKPALGKQPVAGGFRLLRSPE